MKKSNYLKRTVLLALSGLLAFSLVACNDKMPEKNKETAKEQVQTKEDEQREEILNNNGSKLIKAEGEMSKEKKFLLDYYKDYDDNMLHYNEVYGDHYALDLDVVKEDGSIMSIVEEAKSRDGIWVEFMAPWCPGCKDVAVEIETITEKTKKDVVSVAVGTENYEEIHKFKEETNSNGEIYISSNPEQINEYSVQFIPTMIYIDGSGIVRGVISVSDGIEGIESSFLTK